MGRLSRESGNRSTRNAKLRALINEGQQLWEFLRQWQDYLAADDAGNIADARQKLQNLVGNSRDFSSIMPRSELLARLNALQSSGTSAGTNGSAVSTDPLQEARKLVESIKTFDEIPAILVKLGELQMSRAAAGNSSATISTLNSSLREIGQSYEDIRRGFATRIGLASLRSGVRMSSLDQSDVLGPLRYQLVLLAIPKTLGMPEDAVIKPGENPGTFLQLGLDEAKGKEDWNLAGKILEVAQMLNLGTVASTNDSTALRSFLAGLNQERAGQYALAVASYQAVLKSGSEFISPEMVGTHLAAIKKASPEEFEKGIQITLNPPAPPSDDRFPGRGYPPGYPYPGRPVATPTPVLEVPAKAAAPAATPTPAAK